MLDKCESHSRIFIFKDMDHSRIDTDKHILKPLTVFLKEIEFPIKRTEERINFPDLIYYIPYKE